MVSLITFILFTFISSFFEQTIFCHVFHTFHISPITFSLLTFLLPFLPNGKRYKKLRFPAWRIQVPYQRMKWPVVNRHQCCTCHGWYKWNCDAYGDQVPKQLEEAHVGFLVIGKLLLQHPSYGWSFMVCCSPGYYFFPFISSYYLVSST